MYREMDFDSYLFRIINFTNSETDLTALPKLDVIFNLIDLKNISRLKGTAGAIEVAHSICEIVFPMIDTVRLNNKLSNGSDDESENGDEENTETQSMGYGW